MGGLFTRPGIGVGGWGCRRGELGVELKQEKVKEREREEKKKETRRGEKRKMKKEKRVGGQKP